MKQKKSIEDYVKAIYILLYLRDMASGNRLVMWFINHIEIPTTNRVLRKEDVHVYSRTDIRRLCDGSGLKLELYEVRKGF